MLRKIGLGKVLLTFYCCVLGPPAYAADIEPMLRVDTGGHRDSIWDMTVSRNGRYLVSGSSDKTVHLWPLRKGDTKRQIFAEIDRKRYGEVYALAHSPTQDILAVGGYMDRECWSPKCGSIRLFDMKSRKLLAVLSGHRSIVTSLSFSSSGKLLASASSDGTIGLWDVNKRSAITRESFVKGNPRRVRFIGRSNELAASGNSTGVHIYAVEGEHLVLRKSLKPGYPSPVLAVSADGTKIAGGGSNGILNVWSWPAAKLIQTYKLPAKKVTALTFGSGKTKDLLAAALQADPFPVLVFDTARESSETIATYGGHDDTVTAAVALADGRFATAGGDRKEIHLWRPKSAKPEQILAGPGRTIRSVGFIDVTAKSAATKIQARLHLVWGDNNPCPKEPSCPEILAPLKYEMRLPAAKRDVLSDPDNLANNGRLIVSPEERGKIDQKRYVAALERAGQGKLTRSPDLNNAKRFPTLKLGSVELNRRPEGKGEDHVSYSYSPDGNWVVSGGRNGVLEAFATNRPFKPRTNSFKGHTGDIWSVAVSPDNKLIASGGRDQTIRLWNLESGELIVTLLHLTNGEWIMWTPQGYYDSSQNGDRYLRWQVNRGADKQPDVYSADQFLDRFYKPRIVARAIRLRSAKQATKGLAGATKIAKDFRIRSVPKFRIVEPRPTTLIKNGSVDILLDVVENKADPLQAITIKNKKNSKESITRTIEGPFKFPIKIKNVGLRQGNNKIEIVLINSFGESNPEKIWVRKTKPGELNRKGTLHILAIGVNEYDHQYRTKSGELWPKKLKWAVRDAVEFAKEIAKTFGKQFAKVAPPQVLVSGGKINPTQKNISDALDSLKTTRAVDAVAIFFAGHGDNSELDGYVFLPQNAKRSLHGGWATDTVIQREQLLARIGRFGSGKRLLVLDTCRSGNAFDTELNKRAEKKQIYAFTSTNKKQDAAEYNALKHGVFTYFMLKGLRGDADKLLPKKVITSSELGLYVQGEVHNYAENRGRSQTPDYNKLSEELVLVRLP